MHLTFKNTIYWGVSIETIKNRIHFIVTLPLVSILVLISFSVYFFNGQVDVAKKSKNVQEAVAASEALKYLMSETNKTFLRTE
ncbi:hypothetical protein [Halobacillus campisalis]|uniref:Uncharacterized protein n=1 Tax=Halobacillus campisalis TaxID=435909 RepID=A0ABW2K2N9_9BACI|nr:hypothetical protein [Halobacillus campisalis]